MCKEISVTTMHDEMTVLKIAGTMFVTSGNNSELVVERSNENYNVVFILGINGKCTCNLTDEEKIEILDFILKISDRMS
jgi:hypothetical protein